MSSGLLLDTNVLSEPWTPRPHPAVVKWLHEVDEDRTFLSVISTAEVRLGIESLPPSRRRERLEWLVNELEARFDKRVLGVDLRVGHEWAKVVSRRRSLGLPINTMDAFLAATAIVHDLVLVTRNAKDFQSLGIEVFNPWQP